MLELPPHLRQILESYLSLMDEESRERTRSLLASIVSAAREGGIEAAIEQAQEATGLSREQLLAYAALIDATPVSD